jgi:hypothetical protein
LGGRNLENLLIIEEDVPTHDKFIHSIDNAWYQEIIKNMHLHNEFLNIKNMSTSSFEQYKILQLQCCDDNQELSL